MAPPGSVEVDGQEKVRTLATVVVPEFSEQEVAQHITRKDCWVIYKDVVYDVSSFVEDHPGGPEIVMQYAGQDISKVFHSIMSHDHSDAAISILGGHKIGVLKDPQFRVGVRSKEEQRMFFASSEPEVIDLEKPIVTQMWAANMPLAQYLRYTHTPHFLKGGRVARFFENPFMEFISRNTWHSVLLWIPVVLYFISIAREVHPAHTAAFLFAGGIFLWTFLEYSIHRFLFHIDGHLPDHPLFVCGHFLLHGVHHFLPMDRYVRARDGDHGLSPDSHAQRRGLVSPGPPPPPRRSRLPPPAPAASRRPRRPRS